MQNPVDFYILYSQCLMKQGGEVGRGSKVYMQIPILIIPNSSAELSSLLKMAPAHLLFPTS